MTKLLLVGIILFSFSKPVWLHDIETAKQAAKKEHKFILLNFSGSDWCIPCIKMHDDIFESEAFSNYANDHLVLVNADFPRKKKNQLSKEQQSINDQLAERYNSSGNFPFTLLLDSNGNKIKAWDGYYSNGTERFIQEIKQLQDK